MQRPRRPVRRFIAPTHCSFCESKTEPMIDDIGALNRHVTERGMILSRERSGLCSKHQKALTRLVKQARFMGLLPYLARA